MTQTGGLTDAQLGQMRRAFFDVTVDNHLFYADPAIGALRNGARQVAVMVNRVKARLEGRVAGAVVEVFALGAEPAAACQAACAAYFRAFAAQCQCGQREGLAA